jgi:Prokaryotic RING finger family 1
VTPETVRRLKINKRYEGEPCRWCGQLLLVGDDGAICGACEGLHHASCWDQQNGCNGNPACVNRPLQQLQNVAPVGQRPQTQLKPGESFCSTCGDIVTGYCFRCQNVGAIDYTGPKRTSPEAKEALKYALIGLLCFGFVLGPLAIIRGTAAKKTIAHNPMLEGEGLATAAQIIGGIEVLLFVGWILRVIIELNAQ